MIRLFTALCKLKLKNESDKSIFADSTNGFGHHREKCPFCGAIGKLSPYGSYSRNLVSYKDGCITEERICTIRFKCASCGTTHALLPDVLIPYSPYSLRFKLAVLLAYFQRKTTVQEVCTHFCIAVSTLYEWKRNFLKHKELLLGVLVSRKEPTLDFLLNLFGSEKLSNCLCDFFSRYTFSFMQNRSLPATRSHPP
jgi:hypothetical protein